VDKQAPKLWKRGKSFSGASSNGIYSTFDNSDRNLRTLGNTTFNSTWMNPETACTSALTPSYPAPYHQRNMPQAMLKQSIGYINDGTASNPSDPNTMQNQGTVRNSIFNIPIKGIPEAKRVNSSQSSLGKYQGVNQTIYSYGA
jgi:hypothetical protein